MTIAVQQFDSKSYTDLIQLQIATQNKNARFHGDKDLNMLRWMIIK